ncbi:MAG: phospho-N-acetylmuramoyl-pentapeptide-transferase, partial [Caldilinea sp.]|nr:phospho-N-acetylmuramoyl-pentapeptide-transferase [Caldilinea sp.]
MDNPLEPRMAYALSLGTISFLFAVLWGRPLIRFLQHKGVGKQIRIEQPGHHQLKTGTPTMGGVLFVVPVLVIIGLLNIVKLLGMDAIGQSTLLLFFCLGSHVVLGAIDDWQGIQGLRGRGEGMSPRMKSAFQVL